MPDGDVVVIVPAAGSGVRFGGDVTKQFRMLRGRTVLQRVIDRFLSDDRVRLVIVPVAPDRDEAARSLTAARVRVVTGGATRLASVARGFDQAEESTLVAIHDAVRPLFDLETFHVVLDAALEYGAALPVISLTDTVHAVAEGLIVTTPDRRALVAAQTPQCFRAEVLRDVLARALQQGDDTTDEAGLAARYGHQVRTVPGNPLNFKITRPEDFAMAERVIAGWEAEP